MTTTHLIALMDRAHLLNSPFTSRRWRSTTERSN
jgi:hypothetical protein